VNHTQNSIQSVSGIEKLHDDAGYGDWRERRKQRAEIDGVFFSGDETACTVLFPQGRELADIVVCIGIMIAIELGCGRLNASVPQLLDEFLRASDAAEGNWAGRGFGNGHAAS
jgi:hypothetical protein